MNPQSSKRIAVLGAGPMGLAVAYQLALDGHKPIVFEADDRIGGMTAAFDFNGTQIERYYHFHCKTDYPLQALLAELNLAHKMQWVETKMGYWYQKKLQPWGNPIALLKFKGLSLPSKLRYGLHAFYCVKRKNWKKLDALESTSWIKRWVGKQAYEVLWSKLFDFKFYEYSSQLSAAWVWSRIHRIGRSRQSLLKEKLGYIEGGTATLLNALKLCIESHGGEIRLSTPIKQVQLENNRVTGIHTPSGFQAFDTVISTIPLPYVPQVIPDLPKPLLAKFTALKNIAVICVILKLTKPVTQNFWTNINDEEMDIPGIIEYTNLCPLDKHIVYVPFYMPGEHPKFQDSNDVFFEKVRRYLKILNPELSDEDFIAQRASRYRYAQPVCGPGYLDQLPPTRLPVEGLWVADTSYYYPNDRGMSESIEFGRHMAKDATHDACRP